jgi:hypothetical protein
MKNRMSIVSTEISTKKFGNFRNGKMENIVVYPSF